MSWITEFTPYSWSMESESDSVLESNQIKSTCSAFTVMYGLPAKNGRDIDWHRMMSQ